MKALYLYLMLVMIVGLALTLGSCAPSPVTLSEDFGRSVEMARSGQILNPDAEANLDPVEGFDGRAAEKAIERYRKSFDRPATTPGKNLSSFIDFQ